MKKCFILCTLVSRSSKTLIEWLTAVILLLVVQCTVVVNAVLSNSFLSVATAVSVHLAEPSTPLTVLLPCLLRYSIRTIVTVSLRLTLNSDISFSKIGIFFLFKAVQSVIFRLFFKDNKSENFIPGFNLVLHTFGRNLKWNPPIYCLVSEGGIGNSSLWRTKTHFNYTFVILKLLPNTLDVTLADLSLPLPV